jgi:hypothetical protein
MKTRPEMIEKAAMHYAPVNELGVVFLFAEIAPKLRIRIEEIRASFPDCIAYQKSGDGKEVEIKIEFEYKSRNFLTHKHNERECDWIVCWEHDWPDYPRTLKILELRTFYGKGQKFWIQPVIKEQYEFLDSKKKTLKWALSKRSNAGDILLMYRASPYKGITDIFIRTGDIDRGQALWRDGDCYGAEISRLCKVDSPIFFEDFKNHRILRTAKFMRVNMQGNHDVTEYWPFIYQMLLSRNPELTNRLEKYKPENI